MGRGKHARDEQLFGPAWHAPLRRAVGEYAWLLSRGYPEAAALELATSLADGH